MTTIIRRKRTSRSEIGPYKRHESLTGKIVYPVQGYSGYGDGSGIDLAAFISGEMRADWEARPPQFFLTRSRGFSHTVIPTRCRARRERWTSKFQVAPVGWRLSYVNAKRCCRRRQQHRDQI